MIDNKIIKEVSDITGLPESAVEKVICEYIKKKDSFPEASKHLPTETAGYAENFIIQ